MNKAFNFLLVLFFSALLFVSCEKEPILEVSQSSLTFTVEGGTESLTISTNQDWTATIDGGSGWCNVTPINSGSKSKSITVSVSKNKSFDIKVCTITLTTETLSKTINITQDKNRSLILPRDFYAVATAGDIISVDLNTNVEIDVIIPVEYQQWITNTISKGIEKSTLFFSIAHNSTNSVRNGKIIFKDKNTSLADTATITQAHIEGQIADSDGNFYATVKIGEQTWMAENLKTTKYRNGDDIDKTIYIPLNYIDSKFHWAYLNKENAASVYGRLYTWYAATDPRGICPLGWHLPNVEEWFTLTSIFNDNELKEAGNEHWEKSSIEASNSSGFTALPGGRTDFYSADQFTDIKKVGYWWLSGFTEIDYSFSTTPYFHLSYDNSNYGNMSVTYDKHNGFSVRCIKD